LFAFGRVDVSKPDFVLFLLSVDDGDCVAMRNAYHAPDNLSGT